MIEIAIAAALMVQAGRPEQWHYSADTGDALFAIDVANIRDVGGLKRFRYLAVTDPRTQRGDDVHGITFAEMDCANETMRLLQQTIFINGQSSQPDFSREAVYITPGTISVGFYNVVCNSQTEGVKATSIDMFKSAARTMMAGR